MDKGPLPSHLREIGIPEWGNGGHGHPLAWWETREYAVYLRTRARVLAECKAAVEEARISGLAEALGIVYRELPGEAKSRIGARIELAIRTYKARAEGRGEVSAGYLCNHHRRLGATDSENCTICAREDTEERTRARVLAEVRESVEEIVLPMMETGIRSNTGIKILALFDKGGPLDPDTTHGKDQPCESK